MPLDLKPVLFRHLICLQVKTPPNTAKHAQSYVMAPTLSKQHQTNNWLHRISAFDTKKRKASNVICLDRNRITKTPQLTKTSQLSDTDALKPQGHNNGIKRALMPMFKNNSPTLSKILFLVSPQKTLPK